MKKNKTYTSALVFMVFSFTLWAGCKQSFLEIEPKGKLVAKHTNDYDLLLNNIDLISFFSSPQVIMGDEVASMELYFNQGSLTNQRLFRWDSDIYEVTDEASELSAPLKALYTYNKIINEVEKSSDGTPQQKNSILAEALAGRAWVNFYLINLYGKPYQSSTAGIDLGIPLITEANVVNDNYERATVQAVYDLIVKDLRTAIPMLPDFTIRIRMSKAAGEALLGKVYLFMNRPSEALPLFNSAFSDLQLPNSSVKLYNYNTEMTTGGAMFPLSASFGPPYPLFQNDQEGIYGRRFSNGVAGFSNFALINKETVNLFKSSDLRRNFFSSTPFPSGAAFANDMQRRLAPNFIQFGVALPDLYLLSAEAKVRNNDLSGAVTDLETLRSNRMPTNSADFPVPTTAKANQVNLLKFVFEERLREYALMGYRWFDMRRLSVDPIIPTQVFKHSLYLTNGEVRTITLPAERLVMRFPRRTMQENPNMPNNP